MKNGSVVVVVLVVVSILLLLVGLRCRRDKFNGFGMFSDNSGFTGVDPRVCSRACGCSGLESFDLCQQCNGQCNCVLNYLRSCDGPKDECLDRARQRCIPNKIWYRGD